LGQLFKITPDLKQYVVAKFTPRRRIVTMLRPNPIIASMVINLHMTMIQVQVGKNLVEDVILDGRSNMDIMTKELWKCVRRLFVPLLLIL
jgi:hypothetical protein